jgi:lysophospholipase L1-like esterase
LHDLTVANNQKLATAVADLQKAHSDVHFAVIDVYSIVNDFIQNPDKYNQKYNKTIKNVTQACWTGSINLHQDEATRMTHELQQTFIDQGKGIKDTSLLSKQLLSSPSIAESYAVGKAFELGLTPCDNPDTYFFWDHVHPTAVTHDVLASIVEETLKI